MTEKEKDMHDKSLDKMTVAELREAAKDIPDITGVHSMKKAELLEAVSAAKGIKEESLKKPAAKPNSKGKVSVRELKIVIKSLRHQKTQALADKDTKMAKIYQRRISRLKKKTRQAV